jgi:hypothetical protein
MARVRAKAEALACAICCVLSARLLSNDPNEFLVM